ncbi:hypothetical protein M9Y10_034909 [Tritrichomonas musculus]|uniref:Protein kinase domain-containing protein n=1 Tax=Tritrichomonas musculus TaxID=1915356 RepID=A0ABR2KGE0_9EUKA
MKQIRESKSRFCRYIVDIKDFKMIERIGGGGFGSVFLVQNLKTGENNAAKVINLNGSEEYYKRMINREIGIMIRCQHPTIIQFKGFSIKDFHDDKNVTIFMDHATKGSLASFLQKVKNGLLEEIYDNTNRQILLIGIARGMMYLHQHQIIHRDLKTDNILLDDNLYPLITDFGLSKFYGLGLSMSQSQQCGTLIYMAPEIMEGFQYNGKVDVYSFGILMYEIVTDSIPYPDLESRKMTSFQFTNKVVNENFRPKFEVPVKKSIQELIEKCWSKNPKERPTFEEIFKKLAYNIEESIDDIYDDQDVANVEEERKYYLDDVDEDAILFYADQIDEANSVQDDEMTHKFAQLKQGFESKLDLLLKENEEIKNKNLELNRKLDEMTTKFNKLNKKIEEEFNPLKQDYQEMKAKINDLNNIIDSLKSNIKESTKAHKQPSINSNDEKVEDAEMTVDEFNNLPIQSQKFVASKFKRKGSQFFKNVNDLLQYLLQYKLNDSVSYFRLEKNKDSQNISEANQICLLTNSVEILSENESFSISDFCDILSNFETIFIELKYQSASFDKLFAFAKNIKDKLKEKIEISLFLSSIEKIDSKIINEVSCISFDNSVVNIEKSAFKNWKSLKKVIIPSTITIIEGNAFEGCSSLTQITIPSSVTSIGNNAFKGCISLAQITIPSSVTEIKYSPFNNCTSLTEFIIPSSVTKIEQKLFSGCSSLTKLTIPSSISEIKEGFLYNCPKLSQLIIQQNPNSSDYRFKLIDNKFIVYKSDKSSNDYDILLFVLHDVVEITIPSYIKKIASSALNYCSLLKEVIIPSSVTSIGESAFENCSSLIKVSIPSSITKIEEQTFKYCSSLIEIKIPSSVKSIGDFAFFGCKSLKEFEFPSSVTEVGRTVIAHCESLTDVTIPSSVTKTGITFLSGCTSLKKTTILSPITMLEYGFFRDCTSLADVKLPSTLKTLEEYAFCNCTSLKKIELPSSLNVIGISAFYNCTSLIEINIPSSVTEIKYDAFCQCSSLTKINIPSSVTVLENALFFSCKSLKKVTIPSSITEIKKSVFLQCSSLTEISIPSSVTKIGERAFAKCASLTEIDIPSSVTEIGKDAFYYSALKQVSIPSSMNTNSFLEKIGIKSNIKVIEK